MEIVANNSTSIGIANFKNSHKQAVVDEVLNLVKDTVLCDAGCDYSYELGFTLPITHQWREIIIKNSDNKKHTASILGYHGERRFLFNNANNDDTVTHLRTKDSMKWWTTEEINKFVELIQIAVSKLNLNV